MRLAALALALLGVLVLAPAADAYERFPGYHWPTHTIKYVDATKGKYKKEIASAASAWNKSGAKVSWKRVSKRGSGVVPITVSSKIPTAGLATTFFATGRIQGKIELQPGIQKSQLTKLAGLGVATQVVTHEMGHIMGLDHEVKKCAVMQPQIGLGCKTASEPWLFRCRLLEKDDIRGGVSIFGGRIGKVGPEFCDAVTPPGPPTNVEVVVQSGDEDFGSTVEIRFVAPKGEVENVRVSRRKDVCPTGVDDKEADFIDSAIAEPGKAGVAQDLGGFPGPGRYCYALQAFGPFSRPGKVVTVEYEHTGPPPQNLRPQAYFSWDYDANDPEGKTIVFADASDHPDETSRIVSWRWDFADGTRSEGQTPPPHRFDQPGEYSVTLTVTDDKGNTDVYTESVFISDPIDQG